MPGIRAAHHTSFTVADIARSVWFFRDLLGLELLFERDVREPYLGQVTGLKGAAARLVQELQAAELRRADIRAVREPEEDQRRLAAQRRERPRPAVLVGQREIGDGRGFRIHVDARQRRQGCGRARRSRGRGRQHGEQERARVSSHTAAMQEP